MQKNFGGVVIVGSFLLLISCGGSNPGASLAAALLSQGTFVVDGNLPLSCGSSSGSSSSTKIAISRDVAPTDASSTAVEATFSGNNIRMEQGSSVLLMGTWRALDDNTVAVTSGNTTTSFDVQVEGETLFVAVPSNAVLLSCGSGSSSSSSSTGGGADMQQDDTAAISEEEPPPPAGNPSYEQEGIPAEAIPSIPPQ